MRGDAWPGAGGAGRALHRRAGEGKVEVDAWLAGAVNEVLNKALLLGQVRLQGADGAGTGAAADLGDVAEIIGNVVAQRSRE